MNFKTKSISLAISVLLCLITFLFSMPVMAYATQSDIIYEEQWYIVESEQKLCVTGRITTIPERSFYALEVAVGGEVAFSDEIVFKYDVKNRGKISGGTYKGTITNHGTINGGIFHGTIKESNIINGGTFNGEIQDSGTINGGTFNADVKNNIVVNDGTFNKALKNYGTINGGMFLGAVTNERIINDGTFRMMVTNNDTIENGTFKNTVANNHLIKNGTFGFVVHNNGIISNGTFGSTVFNNEVIYNGKFTVEVRGKAPKAVTHSVNGIDKTFTYGNNILDELGDAGDGYEWFVDETIVTDGAVPQVYTQYIAKEYSHSTIQGGNGGSSAEELILSEIQRIEQELSKFDITTVNADNVQSLEQLEDDIDFLLNYDELTDAHKEFLEAAKKQVAALITAINTPDEGTQENNNTDTADSSEIDNSQSTSVQPDVSQHNGNKYIAIWITVILCAVAVVGIVIYRKIKA